MRLLLIEDDDNKRKRIVEVVVGEWPSAEIADARSFRSAQELLDRGHYDVAIMDMSMPTFDVGPDELGGNFEGLAGRELLRYMDRYGIKLPVVVLTQFNAFGTGKDAVTLDQLDLQLQNEHTDEYLGTIYYDTATDEWKARLLAALRRITKGKRTV